MRRAPAPGAALSGLMSLRSQLILLFLALALGSTALFGSLAYNDARESIASSAVAAIGTVAQDRKQRLLYELAEQRRRASNFLRHLPARCTGGSSGPNARDDFPSCARTLAEFQATEDISSAVLSPPGAPPLTVGDIGGVFEGAPPPKPGQLARFGMDATGRSYYVIRVTAPDGGAALTLYSDVRKLAELFRVYGNLGASGETFLADSSGRPLTPIKYKITVGRDNMIAARPMRECLAGRDGELLAPDYRNADIVHGFRYLPETGGGCVMAHIGQTEAFLPIEALRKRTLAFGVLLGVVAILISVFLAKSVTQPISRLADSARALGRGEYDHRVAADGPAEVQEFSRTFAAMGAAIRERTHELEVALKARARFYNAMNHELRTPVNAILGYNELLLTGVYGALSDEQRTALLRSHSATQHLRDLVNDVLDLSKIEAGHAPLRWEPIHLPSFVEELLGTVHPTGVEHGVSLALSCDEPSVLVSDPTRVRQILLNLLSNAIKFGRGKPVSVRCLRLSSGRVGIEVVDQGSGIALEDQARIFEEFVQVGGSRHPGTGLGLPIAKRLAELLGGTLEVRSTVGAGSSFRVTLPLTPPGRSVASAADVHEAHAGPDAMRESEHGASSGSEAIRNPMSRR